MKFIFGFGFFVFGFVVAGCLLIIGAPGELARTEHHTIIHERARIQQAYFSGIEEGVKKGCRE